MQQILIAERLTQLAPDALIFMVLAFITALVSIIFIVSTMKDFQ